MYFATFLFVLYFRIEMELIALSFYRRPSGSRQERMGGCAEQVAAAIIEGDRTDHLEHEQQPSLAFRSAYA